MGDVRTRIADVAIHLPHHTDMLIAVEQRVLILLLPIAPDCMRGLVGLEAGIRQDDDETLGVLVTARDGDHLLGDQLR